MAKWFGNKVTGWKMDEKGNVTKIKYLDLHGQEKEADVDPKLGEKIRKDVNAGHFVKVTIINNKVTGSETSIKKP